MARDPRLRRAPHPGGARRAARRRLRGRATCSRAAPTARATSTLRVRGDDRRRRAARSTSPAPPSQVEGNLNCPLSVTKSAAFFAVRVLTDPDAPPSAGAHRPVEVVAPEGSLLNARAPAAVAAGNVETSSRVADLVIAALAGATPAPGAGPGDDEQPDPRGRRASPTTRRSAAARAPAPTPTGRARSTSRCRTRSTRRSRRSRPSTRCACASSRCAAAPAAPARHRGGDGIVREIEALAPMRFTLITERRRHAPRGRDGGEDGAARAQPAQRRASCRRSAPAS